MPITIDLRTCKKFVFAVSAHSLGDGIHIEEHVAPHGGKPLGLVIFNNLTYGGGFEFYLKVHRKSCEGESEYNDADYLTYHLHVYYYTDRTFTSEDFIQEKRNITLTKPWVCNCLGKNYSTSRICQYCYQNRFRNILSGLAMIPGIGIPFGFASAVLAWGESFAVNKVHFSTHHLFTAVFETVLCIIDAVSLGFVVGMASRLLLSAVRAGQQITSHLLQSCIQQTVAHVSEHAASLWAEGCAKFGQIFEKCISAGRVQYRKLLIETRKLKNH